MINHRDKANKLRALHVPGAPLVLFNVWDIGSCRAVAAAGAHAIGTSSWSVAAARGFADGERITRVLALDVARDIVGATDLPVTVDLESGYGDTPASVHETIAEALAAGIAGCNLEDSIPGDGTLRPAADQAARIARARAAADAAGVPLFINARTDVFLQRPATDHSEALIAETLDRARTYAEAGADGFFAPGLTDVVLIAQLARLSPRPLNIMVTDSTLTVSALASAGVARVSHGPMPWLLAMKALEEGARAAGTPGPG